MKLIPEIAKSNQSQAIAELVSELIYIHNLVQELHKAIDRAKNLSKMI